MIIVSLFVKKYVKMNYDDAFSRLSSVTSIGYHEYILRRIAKRFGKIVNET